MSNNKAREINSPIIKQLIDETTPKELAKIDAEMTNNKQQTEHRFCVTPELKCTMSYCDENGCINRQRHLVGDPIEMTNNKQQTAMKLYTEEQLINTAEAIRDYLKNYPEKFHESMIEKHLKNLTPIELPTEEQIEEKPKYWGKSYKIGFVDGKKWMRDKIQGGNK
jgi:hypothetical protein